MEQSESQSTSPAETIAAQDSLSSERPIAGFWKRLIAFGLDVVLLGLLGSCLGLFLVDYFVSIGGWGRIIGFIIAGVYFSIMNSHIGGGQTIGKRIMKIKVVDREGNAITLGKSTFRYIILGIPYFLNGANLPNTLLFPPIGYLIGIIVFGGIVSFIYLYIFNRPTRQCLHDMAVGSFVIKREYIGSINFDPIWKGHWAIVGTIISAIILFMYIGMPIIGKQTPFKELIDIENYIDSSKKYSATKVMAGTSTFNGHKSTFLRINVITYERKNDYKPDSLEVAAMVKNKYPDILGRETLYVAVSYGYDIGIASYWHTYNGQFSRSDLKTLQYPQI